MFRKTFLVVVLVSFAGWAGYVLGQRQARLVFKNFKPAIVANQLPTVASGVREADFAHFWEVWNKVSELYVDKAKLDASKMVDGAIAGMVSAIGDPYTAYFTQEQNKSWKEDISGAFEGVGIQLGYKESRLVVQTPLDGTPAKRAGVRSGDLILRIVDEKNKIDRATTGITIQEAVKIIRGPKGSEIKLTLFREGDDKPFDVTLVRDTIVVKSVTLQFLEDDQYAWLKMSQFGDRTQEEWGVAISDIQAKAATGQFKGVVLDLRNNPGGYLDGAVYLAGEFLQAGKVIVSRQEGGGSQFDYKVSRNGNLLKMPLVVLVNGGSASAAEIMSGALADHGRAKIVGEKSFGKGSVQQPEDFTDGSSVHVTIAKWLRPNGEWIDKVGITPDYVVEWDNGDTTGDWKNDPQLVKAVELL